MDSAPDGSPVGVYALFPARGEGAIIARAVPPGASILELGCGAGRMTRQLVELGFRVTAVDESAAMLAHVRNAEVVEAKIEGLEAVLAEMGPRLDRWLDRDRGWFVATAEPARA